MLRHVAKCQNELEDLIAGVVVKQAQAPPPRGTCQTLLTHLETRTFVIIILLIFHLF